MPKPQRPYLKICRRCKGKGQLSYFDTAQVKQYRACDYCTNGNPQLGLGVTLKCVCQALSCHYEFATTEEAGYFKDVPRRDVRELQSLQESLEQGAVARLLVCDCGGRYLSKELGRRRKLGGGMEPELNKAAKENNRAVASSMVAGGIVRTLEPSPTPAVK